MKTLYALEVRYMDRAIYAVESDTPFGGFSKGDMVNTGEEHAGALQITLVEHSLIDRNEGPGHKIILHAIPA